MKNLKRNILIFWVVILIIIITIFFFINKKESNVNNNTEYQPEEEISINQERKTIVSLYFINKTTKKLEPEARLIDVKPIVEDPYNTILNLLLEGPKKENLEKIIPDQTKVNNVTLEGNTLIIDFSTEFIENYNEENDEKQIIDSIVKTLTELTEVDSIKILINGEENKQFKNGTINFNDIFIREE